MATSEQRSVPGLAHRGSSHAQKSFLARFEPYGLLLPALIVLCLFFFGPAAYNVYLSFQKISLFELAKGGDWVGIDNYTELFGNPDTGLVLKNTIFWLTIVTVAIRLALGLGLALLLNMNVLRRWRVSGIARSLILVPWVTPPVVAVAAWQWLLHPRYGALNQILLDLRIINEGIPFLVKVDTVWWSIVAMFVWRELPFAVIMLLAGLQAIPEELYEAARIDGASKFNLLRFVTLPLLRPVLAVTALLMTIWTFNNFVYVWLATRGGPGNFTQVLATQMYTEAFTNFRLGLGASIGTLMSVIMMVFALVYFFVVLRKSIGQNMSSSKRLKFVGESAAVLFTFAVLGLLVFPFVWVFLTSIRPESELFIDNFRLFTETISFDNYKALLDADFLIYIGNSIFVSLTTTVLTVAIAFLAAYSFSRRQFRFRNLLLIIVVFSQLFPFIILITPIYAIFFHLGLVNTYQGLVVAYIAITLPFSIYMLYGYLDSVPRELDEAAIIDGCTTIGVIWRVVLPVAWPGVAATAIYAFAQAWNEFLFALTLVTQNELKTVPVGLAGFFGQYTTQWDLVMSASVIATLPTLVVFLVLQRQLVSGLSAGAVK